MENHIILPSGRHWNRGATCAPGNWARGGPGAVGGTGGQIGARVVLITSPAMSPLDLAVRGVLAIAARLRRPHWVWPCVFGDGRCRHLRLSRHRRLHAG
jgi:hypothetical protein